MNNAIPSYQIYTSLNGYDIIVRICGWYKVKEFLFDQCSPKSESLKYIEEDTKIHLAQPLYCTHNLSVGSFCTNTADYQC